MEFLLNLNSKRNSRRDQRRIRSYGIRSSRLNQDCEFCHNSTASYCCPKCKKAYCSVDCYRSPEHLECSENFYKNMIFDHIRNNLDELDQNKVIDILKRNSNGDSFDSINLKEFIREINNDDDDDQLEDLYDDHDWIDAELVKKFSAKIWPLLDENQDDLEKIWSQLSKSDQKEFIQIVKNNQFKFDKMIQIWEPWWLDDRWHQAVEEITEAEGSLNQFPVIYTKITQLNQLTKKVPSPSIGCFILAVCFAYCHLTRTYNGEIACRSPRTDFDDPRDHPPDCCEIWTESIVKTLVFLVPYLQSSDRSDTLSPNKVLDMLVHRFLNISDVDEMSNDLIKSIQSRKKNLQTILSDLKIIFDLKNRQPGYCLILKEADKTDGDNYAPKAIILVLSDLIHILERILMCYHHGPEKRDKNKRKNLRLIIEKLKFYLSYTMEYCDQFSSEQFLSAINFHRAKLKREDFNPLENEI
ncbi:hypothetical protein SSS_04713 [Sarcoptes scabiei]|uniref:HIT-type domain-containing protein n=1 Tax=Sarcoptes scabiei TaxID=52283 RepID=A0A834R591_SARSC|nr:hypothetical protein SSS_04713 [Sarcoptes scabiei]